MHHVVTTYGGVVEHNCQVHAPVALFPWKVCPVPIGWEAGWVTEPIWTLCRRENLFASTNKNDFHEESQPHYIRENIFSFEPLHWNTEAEKLSPVRAGRTGSILSKVRHSFSSLLYPDRVRDPTMLRIPSVLQYIPWWWYAFSASYLIMAWSLSSPSSSPPTAMIELAVSWNIKPSSPLLLGLPGLRFPTSL